MLPKRLSVRYFLSGFTDLELEKVTPVFQRWIQRQTVEGMLIDAADYRHVIDGPGILLIGDEADYAVNISSGRPGVQYIRKRQMPDTLPEALRTAFRLTLLAGQKLQAERTLGNPVVDTTTAEVMFLDRLKTPNTPEIFAALKDEIELFVNELYAGAAARVELSHPDPRECLAIQIIAENPPDADTLIERLTTGEKVSE